MDPDKRARLEKSWAHAYRQSALPLIDEEQFRPFFDEGNGRPNKPVRLVVSVLLLKELFDLTDAEALEQLEWNAAWHYALDLVPEEAHTCQKTLHNFRAKLLGDDQGAELFEDTTRRLIVAAKLKTSRQRHDSTHTVSNIRLLTRLGLFTATLTKFLTTLRQEFPGLCSRLDGELRERYLDREGYFADARSSEAPRRLAQTALDVYALVQHFGAHRRVAAMPSFQLLDRLYHEQCEPPKSDEPVAIELRKDVPSSSLQSPSDPDVTYGHKGKGYSAQLSETCHPDNPIEVITAVAISDANGSDQQQLVPALDQIELTCGSPPETLLADAGYGSGDNLVAAEERGTELLAPIASAGSTESFGVDQFVFNDAHTEVVRCPNRVVPVEHLTSRKGDLRLAVFPAAVCEQCPVRSICPTQRKKGGRVLAFSRATVAVAKRRVEQQRPDFKSEYKARSGIEATNSQLKRTMGMRKLRVRTRPRVALAVRLKALALNIRRWVNHLAESMVPAAASVAMCAC